MKKFLFIAGMAVCLVVWWMVSFPSGAWRYRITVVVDTPEGVKTGSAVRQVRATVQPQILPEVHPVSYEVSGEAVVVDLGERGKLFALVNWDDVEMVQAAFPFNGSVHSKEGIRHFNALKPGAAAELKTYIPQMVMFTDINDPMSVTLVRGGRFNAETQTVEPVDDFEALFGAGVKFKRVSIEITDDPVTWGIEKELGWLPGVLMSNIDGTSVTSENKLSNLLHGGNFITGKGE